MNRGDAAGPGTGPWRAMLFDLDGTLADTAPDLAAAANRMRTARGLLRIAFGKTPDDADYEALRVEFLSCYEAALAVHSRLFDGVPEVLDALERDGRPWGIVTNKAMRFTAPLTALLGLAPRAGAIVGGDTTPHSKPHPAPLQHAATLLDIPASQCIYVGDDPRDIAAGRAAGMRTIAAGWGYGGAPHGWEADAVLAHPRDLIALL